MEIRTDNISQHGGKEIDEELNALIEKTLRMEHELELVIRFKDQR